MKKRFFTLAVLMISISLLSLLTSCAGVSDVQEDDLHQKSREYTPEEKELISHMPSHSEKCNRLLPRSPIRLFEGSDVVLSFEDKMRISDTKFGFIKKIVFEEPVILNQYIQADMNFIYYGLYRDKKLENPVIEVDTYYNLQAFAKIEEGADVNDFPEYMEGYIIKVEPGTYYLGVYTKEPNLNEEVLYLCESIPFQKEISLTAGKKEKYILLDETDSVLCKITPHAKKIRVTGDISAVTFQLLDSEKHSISDVVKSEEGTHASAEFSVKPGETCYIKVQHTKVVYETTQGIDFWNIRYENIS